MSTTDAHAGTVYEEATKILVDSGMDPYRAGTIVDQWLRDRAVDLPTEARREVLYLHLRHLGEDPRAAAALVDALLPRS